jgi:hypothetical protein
LPFEMCRQPVFSLFAPNSSLFLCQVCHLFVSLSAVLKYHPWT